MIKLKETFNKKGISFTQLHKDNDIVIYKLQQRYEDGTTSTWYEVFRPKVEQPNNFRNDQWERYPTNEDFGKWAWSCSNIKVVEKVLQREFNNVEHSKILQICEQDRP